MSRSPRRTVNPGLMGGVLSSAVVPVCVRAGSKMAAKGKKGLQVLLLHPVLQPASCRGASREGITVSLVRAIDHTSACQRATSKQLMVSSEMLHNCQKLLSEVQLHFNLEYY